MVAAVTSLALALPMVLLSSPASARAGAKPYDFNGDGKQDLVVGVPHLNRAGISETGGIVVVPGFGRPKIVTQSTKKVAGRSEPGDRFGDAVASADFDRDGYADLAVGIPSEDFKGKEDAGAVTILYGTAKGLSGRRSKQLSEPSGKAQYANFGFALVAGDLNADRYPDLAVAAPGEEAAQGLAGPTGTVTVLPGGPRGVRTSGSRVLDGGRVPEGGTSVPGYGFGYSLAVANVDGRKGTDLVVVSVGEQNQEYDSYPASVSYCSGGERGPRACRQLMYSPDLQYDGAVVVGNIQGDKRPEIIVRGTGFTGGEDDEETVSTLAVLTLAGSGASTSAHAANLYAPNLGLPDLGSSLALGRVDGDAYDDLVVGSRYGTTGGNRGGRVDIVPGGAAGLAKSRNVTYDQDTPGVPDQSENFDRFGAAVTLLDRNGDGNADLTIGAPGEDDGTGRVTTLLAGDGGFATESATMFDLSDVARHYEYRSGARFGEVLGR